MSTRRHRREALRRVLCSALLAAVAGTLGLLAAAVPAGAHAELVSSDPGQGDTVQSLPSAVTLTFNEPVRAPAFVEVTAPDGTNVAQGDPRIVDDQLTQRVAGTGDGGAYAVAYRITSADGHAITGTVEFGVEGSGPAEQEATKGASQQPAAPADSAPATPEPTPAAAQGESAGIGTTQLLLLLAVLAVGLVAVGIGTQRALRRSATMVEERQGARAPRR